MGDLGDVDRASARAERRARSVAPSLSGRLVEAQAAVRALRDALIAEAASEHTRDLTEIVPGAGGVEAAAGLVEPAWFVLEKGGTAAVEAEKAVMDVQMCMSAARLRGWRG